MRKHILSLGILVSVWLIIVATNVQSGTWLTGWDNLHPEFDFALNIKRSLFAVWQEYQGLGLLGGMGHAADLPRQLILWAASVVLPTHLLRYFWTFSMLLIGPLGVYVLLHDIFFVKTKNSLFALVGALFYLLNLATLQMFSVPFEPFVTHFGFLPWLVWGFFRFMERPSKKSFLALTAINVLAIPQGYVPTIFLVYLAVLSILSLSYLMLRRSIGTIKKVTLIWLITLCTNAFWLLPFGYFTLTQSSVVVDAKINQMATEEVYLRNRAFGTFDDTVQLKGFWFDTFDLDPQKNTQLPVASQWRRIADEPFPIILSWIVFVVISYGAWSLFRSKKPMTIGVVAIFLFAVALLTTDSQPFTTINDWLRSAVPLFVQALRFPFTKVGILAGFSYSVLLAVGLASIGQLKPFFLKRALIACGTVGTILLLLIHFLPVAGGKLFYDPLRQDIPQDYFSLFSYLKTKPLGRIANLPQPTYWGWTYARWGLTGSGFLWYGIEQPIMDRAFDVWSAQNENYYWELSRALYSKNAAAVESVLNKYDVSYVLLDENIISPSNNRALFIEETKTILGDIGDIREIWERGKLTLYEVKSTQSNNFITLTGQLPTVSPTYGRTDNDVAYAELGDYVAKVEQTTSVYPFRSLFTKRAADEREFDISGLIKSDNLIFEASPAGRLAANNVVSCGLLNNGTGTATEETEGFLRLQSLNQRACLSFGVPELSHKDGYIISVESRHVNGRPLLIAFINETVKHVELETYLSTNNWNTSYFVLPPLAPDGLGYSVYLSNDSIGKYETVNNIKSIRFYKLPYTDLVHLRIPSQASPPTNVHTDVVVNHPNPAYYKVSMRQGVNATMQKTLILNQAFHAGWAAWEKIPMFPYFHPLKDHVLVNNWANAWPLHERTTNNSQPTTIVLFFLPQLLQWLGLAILPIPFILMFILRKR
jgi:hypothetical protein